VTFTPDDLSQNQKERLAFLELKLYFSGELRRADIEGRFGVKPAAASRDLALYREWAEQNIEYDLLARCYRPTRGFVPLFPFQPDRVLSWLSQGFGDGLELKLKTLAPYEGPGQLFRPDLTILSALTRALCAQQALTIDYLSLSSGLKTRDIVPVALADNGLRWHLRAYDREHQRFGDFVITRITRVESLPEAPAEHEGLLADEQWLRMVDLELVPHPGLRWPDAVAADYRMSAGVLRLKTRAALAGYVLRRWSVDTSPDHSLDPASHHLWLSNPQTLYGVESAALAPGYPRSGAVE
jgi:WYL domain